MKDEKYLRLRLRQLLRQDALQLLSGESQLEFAAYSDRDATSLLGDDNGDAVALVGDTQSSTMAQAQFLGDIEIVADGQDTACGTDALAGNDHRTIMQG